jgi:hypothetical protein
MMLGEEVLAVEVVVDALVTRDTGIVFGVAGANVAAIETKLKVLDGDVSLPLIFGAQGNVAAIVTEGANELAFGRF